MRNEEAKNKLVAKLICLTRETSGTDVECNSYNCENCSLNYEQGNMGEQKEALDMAIKALEQQPCEDCISREAVIRLVEQYPNIIGHRCSGLIADIKHLPSVTPSIPDVEDNFDIGYNCGYADAMCDIGGES